MTGVAIGMALAGLRPIHVHIRMDFLLLAMNQLVNIAAKSRYMYGGQVSVPLVVRSHDRQELGTGRAALPGPLLALHARPGSEGRRADQPARRERLPGRRDPRRRPGDARRAPAPLPARGPTAGGAFYEVRPGRARVVAPRAATSRSSASRTCCVDCLRARDISRPVGIDAEVIDPISLTPLDLDTIAASVARSGRLLVVDNGWTTCGAGAEIVAQVVERLQGSRHRVTRLGFAPTTCPTTPIARDSVLSRSFDDCGDHPSDGQRSRRHLAARSRTRRAGHQPAGFRGTVLTVLTVITCSRGY